LRAACLAAAALAMIGAVQLYRAHIEARLLRSDPESLPTDAAMMQFARAPGRQLYEAHCASCHGLAGGGDTARGVPALNDADWLYGSGSVADIERVIDYGIRSYHPKAWNLAVMPAYARPQPSTRESRLEPLSPGEIRDVVEYLWARQGRDADVEAARRGAQVYAGRGGCYDCHAPDAQGDSAIGAPNLTDRITLYGDGSREALALSVAYGRQGVCPAWTGRLRAADIRELALYVYSLSHTRRRHVEG
jgi:cytochrome c oxidase cbb3-type subunit 3